MLKAVSVCREKVGARFQLLRWSLKSLEECVELHGDDSLLPETVMNVRYPSWLLRYWWAWCAIHEEVRRIGRPPVIVDMGCGWGLMKRFTPHVKGARWIGLDGSIHHPSLAQARYDEIIACDVNEPLPLPAGMADVVVCLHVLEHVQRPEFAMGEIARILRPGGVLLAGSPVLPKPLALLRECQFRREVASGNRKRGEHIIVFWPGRWREIARHVGLPLEFVAGSHLLRRKGNPLENCRWWVRLNQVWGALFPSLGGDVYLRARAARMVSHS